MNRSLLIKLCLVGGIGLAALIAVLLVLNRTADAAYLAGDYGAAQQKYRLVTWVNPFARLAHARLGFIALNEGKATTEKLRNSGAGEIVSGQDLFARSAAYSERALWLGLREKWVYKNAAFAYDHLYVMKSREDRGSERNDMTKALSYYEEARKLDPSDSTIWNGIGSIYYQEKDYPKAIEYLTGALERVGSADGRLVALLGFSYLKTGDNERAIVFLHDAIELQYKNYFYPPAIHEAKGYAHLKRGELDEAIAECDKAIALDAGNAAAHLWRAQARIAKARTADATAAREDLERLLELAPQGTLADQARSELDRLNNERGT